MRVLNIVTARDTTFFQDQERILEQKGVDCDTVDAFTIASRVGKKDTNKSLVLSKLFGHNLPFYAYASARLFPRLIAKSVAGDYDIIHVNSGMVAPFGFLQHQRPIVITFWGDDLLGNRLYGLQSKIAKVCANRSSAVIVRSEEMAAALPCEAEIIPSGVDMEKFRPVDRQDALRKVGWEHNARHVLFPYDPIKSKKRYPVAKKVVDTVNERISDSVKLQTVFDVPHDNMYLYYNAADALLLPSLREGSPNTVKEAMACNLPVVSTNVGDVQDRLNPVNISFVCESDSELEISLEKVLKSPKKRSNGRKYVQDVSLERMGNRIIEVYDEII